MDSSSLRVTLVGEGGVGKSALIVRFITGRFLHHYDPTLEDEYKVPLQGHQDLAIKDTAGQNHVAMDYYCKTSDVFLVTFSVANFVSLQRAKELVATICSHGNLAVLVGTKSDLKMERQVTYEEGISSSKQMGVQYIETSAAYGDNVQQVFKLAATVALSKRQSLEPSKKNRSKERQSINAALKKWKPFDNDKKLLKSLS